MRAPQYRPQQRFGFNMTPMIDVVFLLIIFFLVSSHLARQETSMELDLPQAAAGDEDLDQISPRVTINVEADGTLWIAGRTIESARLGARLTALRQTEGEGLEVRIRGSREAAYAMVEPIMLACADSGIWNVTYAVYGRNRETP